MLCIKRRNPYFIGFLLILFLCNSSGIAWAEWVDKIIDADVIVKYDDNVNLAFFSSLEFDDTMLIPAASFGRVYQWTDRTRLTLTADLEGEFHNTYDKLNSLFGGTTLNINYKFGVGPYKPWLKVYGTGGYLAVDDDLRTSWLFDTGAALGKRFTDRFDMEIGYNFDYRDAENGPPINPEISGETFDRQGHTGSISASFLLTQRVLTSLAYAFRSGDISSTCDGATVATVEEKTALTRDTAYNEPMCAYRIDGDVHAIGVGGVFAISSHASINVDYHRMEGKASASSIEYSSNIVNAGVNYSFQ